MKKIAFLFVLLCSTLQAQKSKTIVPEVGTIVFKKKEIITNPEKHKKSFAEFISKMVDYQIENELNEKLVFPDSLQIEQLKSEMKMIFLLEMDNDLDNKEEKNIKHILEFKNNNIVQYITSFDEVIKDYTIINPQTQLTKKIASDSLTVLSENKPYEYSISKILQLEEFKQETKLINGYNCFKIIMKCKSNLHSDDEFNNYMNENYILKRELWVTNQIRCNFHPVINEKDILIKYYPLEIVESFEGLEGQITTYTLDKISLN